MAVSLHPTRTITTEIFVSYKKTDGNLADLDTLSPKTVQTATLYETGYHRNLSECEKKHNLKEFTTGLSTHLNHRYFRIGVQLLHYNFSRPNHRQSRLPAIQRNGPPTYTRKRGLQNRRLPFLPIRGNST